MHDLKTIQKMNKVSRPDESHAMAKCTRDYKSLHYHYKSWSAEFECRECGRRGRFNLNYLGNRKRVFCDGVKFHRIEIEEEGHNA